MAEKLRAPKSYKKNHFLYNPVLHFLVALIFSLFFSFPFCFPSISSSMEEFGLISLPSFWSSFFNPKSLFIVVNVIIVFLVGESKLLSKSSPPSREIYNEYVERRRVRRVRTLRTKTKEVEVKETKEISEEEPEKQEKVEEDEYEKEVELEEDSRVKLFEETSEVKEEDERAARLPWLTIEEKVELPAEELNRRVEDFIARINKQRWLEANSLVCYEP